MAEPSKPTPPSSSDSASSTSSSHNPTISWPVGRPAQSSVWSPRLDEDVRRRAEAESAAPTTPEVVFADLLPGHKRSQSGIGTRAFALGITLGASVLLTLYFLFDKQSRLWRPFFFLSTLALFHFLEFWTHARYNTANAWTSTFLLFSNGIAYTAAHSTAMLETVLTSLFFPEWQAKFSHLPLQLLGLLLVVIGQAARTTAMVTAGTNFHHHVQTKHAQGHVLVTSGLYSVLRHPSYFGFFWWAVGTQVVLGNAFSFWIYVLILWRFFSVRIRAEERHLTRFFGNDYDEYRKRTRVGIPFVR